MVERGEDVLEGDRAVLGVTGRLVGRADHLAGAHAAAGQEGEIHRRPVVAAGVLVDLGRAAELAPDDHRDVLVQAAEMQVFDQRREGHVELGNTRPAGSEVLAVRVPAAEGNRDHPHAGLDQPPGHQEMIHAAGRAVGFVSHIADAIPLAEARVFLGQVERIEYPSRRKNLEGPLGEAIHALHGLVVVDRPAEGIELAQERPPPEQALGHDDLVVQAQAA